MGYFGICGVCAISILVLASVCNGQSCSQATSCLTEMQAIVTSLSCEVRLRSIARLKYCISENINDCDATTKTLTNKGLDLFISLFDASCPGGTGCDDDDVVGKAEDIFRTCIQSVENFSELILNAIKDWNAYRDNTSFKGAVQCIKSRLSGCSMLQKYYGQLQRQFPAMPMLEQIHGISEQINGPNKTAAIIQDCAAGKTVRDTVIEISQTCNISKDSISAVPLYREGHAITNYCVPMQNQIDCILDYQDECPAAVSQYMKLFIESYGLTHTVFCNNISIHGIDLHSLEGCVRDDFKGIYEECWAPLMKHFATGGQANDYFDSYSIDAVFKWPFLSPNTIFCDIFKDTTRFDAMELRKCVKKSLTKCTFPHPKQGNVYPIPEGIRYDSDLFKLLLTGPTGYSDYGAYLVGVQRVHLCYTGCVEYEKKKGEFNSKCEIIVRNMADAVSNAAAVAPAMPCKNLKENIMCATDYTTDCPLFQYEATNLLDEENVNKAMNKCEIERPNILPNDYFFITTTYVMPTINTTTYWQASSTKQPITDGSNKSHYSWFTLAIATLTTYISAIMLSL